MESPRRAPLSAALLAASLALTLRAVPAGDAPAADAPAAEAPAAVRHRLLAADDSTRRIAIIDAAGKTEWEHTIGPIHDLALLESGNVLFQLSWTRLVEVDPRTSQVVWEYDAAARNGNAGKRVEVHAFQRLAGGLTLIAESGPARLIEVDRDGRIAHEVKLKVDHPDPHSDTRRARKLKTGTYLVCHERDGAVREYDAAGSVIWEFPVPLLGSERRPGHGPEAFGNQAYSALRLENGNTLIATGNGHSVLEVTPRGEIPWKLEQHDLPGMTLAWVTTLEALPNGHIVLGNCHAGKENPQVIEITREKKVVWTFRDFERFGNSLPCSQIIDR